MPAANVASRRMSRRSNLALLAGALLLLAQTSSLAASKQTLSPFDCSNVAVTSKHSFDLSKISYPIHTSNVNQHHHQRPEHLSILTSANH